jgi:nucleoside phosphorylase/CheY-like chemotaxis protein
MKVLIVDDDSAKTAMIAQALRAVPEFGSDDLDIAGDVVTAKRQLQSVSYALVVLDIALPNRIGDEVTPTAGVELLKEIYERPGYKAPRHVVGLTSHAEIFDEAAADFSASVLTLLQFSHGRDDWSLPLQTLARHIAAAESAVRQTVEHQAYLGIVCALQTPEFDALLRLPWDWRPLPHNEDFVFYHEGRFSVHGQEQRVIAGCVGRKGMASAAVLTSKLITLFRPRYLAMMGITAGVQGRANLGDVVAADVCWDWGSGKWLDAGEESHFHQAPYQVAVDPDIHARLGRLTSDAAALSRVESAWPGPRPQTRLAVRVGPVASGAGVLSSHDKLQAIKSQHRELLAVEMEVYGVFVAAADGLKPRPKFFSLKSVVDFGDSAKNDDYHAYGAFTSASVLKLFVETYL